MSVAVKLKSFIKHGDYFQSYQFFLVVWQMSQCEGMHDSVKAGNVTASERKRLTVLRKCAASSSRALTWNTFVTTQCFKILK